MAAFRQPQPRKRKSSLVWNIMTIILLLGVVCLVFYFVTVFQNPRTFLNPFPPEASPTVFYTETPTSTIIQLPATWTASPTLKPPATRTRASTVTLAPELITQTATPSPTETLTPTITSTAMPAEAEIIYEASTAIHQDLACNWLGVGGTVLGIDNKPLQFQIIQLGGMLDETEISQLKLSGSAPAYGSSGYEFVLGNKPVASTQTLWIQLFDNTGKALTDKIYFDTFDDCNQNLVKITFKRTR
jgi:cytoskeletal protein RodZ